MMGILLMKRKEDAEEAKEVKKKLKKSWRRKKPKI